MKSQLICKYPDAGKDRGQEEKEAKEDDMVGWNDRLNGYEFEQTSGDGERKPGRLHSIGSQRVGHDLETQQQ